MRDWTLPYPKHIGLDIGLPVFLGLFTTTRQFYTVLIYNQQQSKSNKNAHLSLRRIAGIMQSPSKNYVQLCNL